MIIGPKVEQFTDKGIRCHAKEKPKLGGGSEFYFEERDCELVPTSMLLVRITVAKITDKDRLVEILRNTPIQNQPGWNCVSWVKEALESLKSDTRALGTNAIEWNKIRDEAMAYCQRKKDQHRFDGQGKFDMSTVPTYNLMEMREVTI